MLLAIFFYFSHTGYTVFNFQTYIEINAPSRNVNRVPESVAGRTGGRIVMNGRIIYNYKCLPRGSDDDDGRSYVGN